MSATTNALTPKEQQPADFLRLHTACAEQRRRQGPPAATRSGYARALTPTLTSTRPQDDGETQKKPVRSIDRPRPFRNDLLPQVGDAWSRLSPIFDLQALIFDLDSV